MQKDMCLDCCSFFEDVQVFVGKSRITFFDKLLIPILRTTSLKKPSGDFCKTSTALNKFFPDLQKTSYRKMPSLFPAVFLLSAYKYFFGYI